MAPCHGLAPAQPFIYRYRPYWQLTLTSFMSFFCDISAATPQGLRQISAGGPAHFTPRCYSKPGDFLPVPLPTLNKLLPVVYSCSFSQRRSLNVATSVSSSSFLLVGLSLWTSLEKQAEFLVSLLQFSYVIIFSELPHNKLLSR